MLDEAVEYLRDAGDQYTLTEEKRELGVLIARGPTVLALCKEDGFESGIENPYAEQE